MSHTNSTTNYNLPQFITTDKPAWLTDVNQAYTAIDTAIKAAKDAGDNAQGDATQALSDASAAGTTATGADSKASGAVSSIADVFDATATYSVGDLVMFSNLLYKCTVAVTTPGPWTGTTNWTRTTVETEIPFSASDLPITAGSALSTEDAINNIKTGLIKSEAGYANMVSTQTYSDYLYADVDFPDIDNRKIIGFFIVGNSTNRPAFGILMSGIGTATRVRVYATNYSANSTIGVRVVYLDN